MVTRRMPTPQRHTPDPVDYLPLAHRMSRRYHRLLGPDDAYGEAALALVEATQAWKGYGVFIAWASAFITRRLVDATRARWGRNRRRQPERPLDDAGSVGTAAPGSDERLTGRGVYLLEELSKRQREVAFRHLLVGESQHELAERYGVSQPRISQILTRALAVMGHSLREQPAPVAAEVL